MSTKKTTTAGAAEPAVVAAQVLELSGRKEAIERELTQLQHDSDVAIDARIRARFRANETHRLTDQLKKVATDLEAANKALAKQKSPSAPAPEKLEL